MLKLGKEFQPVNYDTTVSSTALVFTKFIIPEWIRRKKNDWKTIGELFFVCCEDVRDIELTEALEHLLAIFMNGLKNGTVQINESIRKELINWYISQPIFIQRICARQFDEAGFLIDDHICGSLSMSA